ncbi:MAG TPA: alpha-amylase family glycosyl hydrolase [Bacillota bacterium]
MQNLEYLLERLRRARERHGRKFYIPQGWKCFPYQGGIEDATRPGELLVEAYDFYATCIEQYFLSRNKGKSTEAGRAPGGTLHFREELYKKVMYSMLPRTFTAWNHGDDGRVYPGTFLKALGLLPYLQSLGVSLVYLLPIFEVSTKYKKGELGSPYAIKNLYQLDHTLHDDLLGECNQELLEAEFAAFIEGCHLLGMKVVVDFVFRTVSRDNDLLLEHPDWFYWIRRQDSDAFGPPVVKRVKKLTALQAQTLKLLYTCEGIDDYLRKFTYSPKDMDPVKWERIVAEQRRTGENILDLIEREFGLTTAPGFSDVLNDPQPPWIDVTYLRFYFDHHEQVRNYLPKEQPPYVLQDVACLNLYQGNEPNKQLWEYVAGVIPYYQKKFGIDGARIDMGHALPPALNKAIITRAKAENPDFILWSEEFEAKRSPAALEDGFDLITGDLWHVYKDLEKPGFCRRLFSTVTGSALPLIGALEMADTPRAVWVYREHQKIEFLVLLNYFIPNSIPFINNGLELLEVQPMNLGLDNTEAGRFVLAPEDPMYGKLAFFDNYRLHWLEKDRFWMEDLLKKALVLRTRFEALLKKEFLVNAPRSTGNGCGIDHKKLVFLHYHQDRPVHAHEQVSDLLFLGNRDFHRRSRVNLRNLLRPEYGINPAELRMAYDGREISDRSLDGRWSLFLNPGAVLILYKEF